MLRKYIRRRGHHPLMVAAAEPLVTGAPERPLPSLPSVFEVVSFVYIASSFDPEAAFVGSAG